MSSETSSNPDTTRSAFKVSVVRIGLGVVGGFVGLCFLVWVFIQIEGRGENEQIVGSTNGGDSSDNKEDTVQTKQGQYLAAFQTIVAAYEKTGVWEEGVDEEVLAVWDTPFDHLEDPEQAIGILELYNDRLEPAMRKYANSADYEYQKGMFTEWAAELYMHGHIKPHHR